MSTTDTDGLAYCCLTHVPLSVAFPSYVTPVYMGDAQGPGRLNVRDLAPEWEPYRVAVGASVATFAFKNYLLENCPDVKQVGLCQYRRFVSRNRIGVSTQNYQPMDVISKADLGKLALDEIMLPRGKPLLIGRPARFDSASNHTYLQQYAGSHHVEDFLRFTAEAVELGVLPKNEVLDFFAESLFFPGGIEIGVFPADFWIPAITSLEEVARACVKRFPRTTDLPRSRSWGFSMERLGSWLLLKYLRTEAWGNDWNQIGGHMNLIAEDEGKIYTPST